MEEHTLFHIIVGASLAMIFIIAGLKTLQAMFMVILIGVAKELYDHFFIVNHIYYCDFDHHLNDWLSNLAFFPVFIFYKAITKKEISATIAIAWMLSYFAIFPRDAGFADKTIWYENEYLESKINLENPYRGFVPWACSAEESAIPYSTVYSTITWAELEPVRGKFNWQALEKCWHKHLKRNRQVAFRLQILSPGSGKKRSYPNWLIEQFKIPESSYNIDGHNGLAFDWNNQDFLKEHERLIKALAKRYDRNSNIAWIEIGSYGFWGEWHMHDNPALNASIGTKKKIYEDYKVQFNQVPLFLPFDDLIISSLAIKDDIGLRNDCLGPQQSNEHFKRSIASILTTDDKIKLSEIAIMSELCGGQQQYEKNIFVISSNDFKILKEYPVSTIGPNGAQALFTQNLEVLEAAKAIEKRIGYRYFLKKSKYTRYLEPHQRFELQLDIYNVGLSDVIRNQFNIEIEFRSEKGENFYLPLDPEYFSLQKEDQGLRKIQISYPVFHFPSKKYEVYFRAYDKRNPKRSIQFANVYLNDKKKIKVAEFDIIDPKDHEQ